MNFHQLCKTKQKRCKKRMKPSVMKLLTVNISVPNLSNSKIVLYYIFYIEKYKISNITKLHDLFQFCLV